MDKKKTKELKQIIDTWSNEFTKVKNMFYLYECVFSVSTTEEKEIKKSVLREYRHFFSFSQKAYLDSIIFNLEKFFQKTKKHHTYFSIKEEVERTYNLDSSHIEKKYNEIRESINKIGIYRNHELGHFQRNKISVENFNTKDLGKLIDFILEFLSFILLEVFEEENDFGEYFIKDPLKKEVNTIFQNLNLNNENNY